MTENYQDVINVIRAVKSMEHTLQELQETKRVADFFVDVSLKKGEIDTFIVPIIPLKYIKVNVSVNKKI